MGMATSQSAPNLVVTGRPPWSCCWCHHLWFVTLAGIPLFSSYGPNRQLEWPYNLDLKMKVGKVPLRVQSLVAPYFIFI